MRRPVLLALALTAALLSIAGAGPSTASAAKDCGAQVIDEYFNTGRIKYHPQECYASALKQVDPDARMYSGIMGAIRAARARDKAADARAADTSQSSGDSGSSDTVVPADAGIAEPEPMPLDESPAVDEQPVEDIQVDEAAIAEVTAVDVTEEQAAPPAPTLPDQVPLPVILLGLLAGILTLVGLGGLAVRWVDRAG